MRRYFLFFILSLAFNALIIVLVMFVHHRQSTGALSQNNVVRVHLGSPGSVAANQEDAVRQWFAMHYHNMLAIDRAFKVGQDIQGYVVHLKTDPQARQIIYSMHHGQYFFLGALLDQSGRNLSLLHAQQLIDKSRNKALYQQLQQLSGIRIGDPHQPQITVIIDPNDKLFPEIWHSFITDIDSKVFSVKWLLINYLKPMGPNVAGYILQSQHPAQALQYSATHYNTITQTAGYRASVNMSPIVLQQLRNNWSLVQRFELYQLPITLVHTGEENSLFHGYIMDETIEALLNDS